MSEFQFLPAVRRNTPMIIGISGASGSGKTFTGLELAMGLAGDGKILLIDTEGRRGLSYADQPGPDGKPRFRFDHCDFAAPYSPQRFLEVLRQAETAGYKVIIVDSMSDEYEGTGGLVEMAAEEEKRVKNSAAAWARPKSLHKLIVRWLRQSRCHVLTLMRADEKVRLEKAMRNGREQTIVVPIGWVPIQEKRWMFEQTTSFLLTPDAPGVPKPIKIQEQHRPFFPLDRPVTRQTGEKLAAWCAGGAPPPPIPAQTSPEAPVIVPHHAPADFDFDSNFDSDNPFGFGDDSASVVVTDDGLPFISRLNEVAPPPTPAPTAVPVPAPPPAPAPAPPPAPAVPPTPSPTAPPSPSPTAPPPPASAPTPPPPPTPTPTPTPTPPLPPPPALASSPTSTPTPTPPPPPTPPPTAAPASSPTAAPSPTSTPSPAPLPTGLGWPAFADAVVANIRAYDAEDLRVLRKSLEGHAFKTAVPMLYARVLGQLVDRERELTGSR